MPETPNDIAERLPARAVAPWAILACLLWATSFTFIKIAQVHVPPLTLAGMRFTLAGLLLTPLWVRRVGLVAALRTGWRVIGVVALLQTVACYGVMFIAMRYVTAARAAIVFGSLPLLAALAAHWLAPNDRMTLPKAALIALGLAGVTLVLVDAETFRPLPASELLGIALLLAAMSFSVLAKVVVVRGGGPVDSVQLNSLQLFGGGLVLLIAGLTVEPIPAAAPPLRFYFALAWLATISAVAFSVWFALLGRGVKLSRLEIWNFIVPVAGAIFAWTIVPGEQADVFSVGGMILVATAVYLSHRQTLRADRAAHGRSR